MSGKTLVIVESPTKAKTISKFLSKEFLVKASNGHVRDLPNSAAEIPAKLKKESWARLGVKVGGAFEALYVIPKEKRQQVKQLQDALKGVSLLYLATDEDREGESISWHLFETLKPRVPVKRLVFHEITKEAIHEALKSAREIDDDLVKAQETRRIVDRLFGYEVSPLLWKKMLPRLSAGRVQSVAVRLLVERERARQRFHSAEFWGLRGQFHKRAGDSAEIEAELTFLADKRVAIGKDFDPETGRLAQGGVIVLTENRATELQQRLLASGEAVVTGREEKPFVSRPPAPFVTSTLQQEANRKLRLSAKRTMMIAQQLYENGFITYMRTDSTTLSDEALSGARSLIRAEFGESYLHPTPRIYKTKVRNAQEAHEAIRPAGEQFVRPEVVTEKLGPDAGRLYEMIWKRTVASQMVDARGTYIALAIESGDAKFRAVGKTVEFPGFLRAYVEGSDDPEAELADQERILPAVAIGERLNVSGMEPLKRATQPPARFTEGSLIKELERLGIGRPSTWATIVDTVLNRSYAFKRGNALIPTFIAFGVVNLLENNFQVLLDYDFTAKLEDDLDAISRGEAQSLDYLKQFYFGNSHAGLKALVEQAEKTVDPREVCGVPVGNTEDGRSIEVRIGRYGPYLTDGKRRAALPDGIAPDEMTIVEAERQLANSTQDAAPLGVDPQSNEAVYLKNGPYGYYIQLGEAANGEKPRMISLVPGIKPEEVTLEVALKHLTLPRTVGTHPESKEKVIVAIGRFGPYVKCGADTRSIPAGEFSPLDMSLEQALELLKQPKGRGRGRTSTPLKELGAHPATGATLIVRTGRYGPYVTDGTLNASLPRGRDPQTLTVEEAVSLLEQRAQKIAEDPEAAKPKRGRKKAKN